MANTPTGSSASPLRVAVRGLSGRVHLFRASAPCHGRHAFVEVPDEVGRVKAVVMVRNAAAGPLGCGAGEVLVRYWCSRRPARVAK